MFMPSGPDFDWFDTQSEWVFIRKAAGALPHSQDPFKKFCSPENLMTTLMASLIANPTLPPGDRTAVIVICPRMLDVLAGTNRRMTATVGNALERRELPWNVHMYTISDTIISPTLFHELCHVAMFNDSK
jgi:hypothetical protein